MITTLDQDHIESHQIDSNNFLNLIQTNENFQWQNLPDQLLQNYQNYLISLNHQQILTTSTDLISSQQPLNPAHVHSPHIQLFRFKDILYDFLEGQHHSISYLGSFSPTQTLQTQIIKQLTSILFKIAQEQKFLYPHLFTHIKEQFYKPHIFDSDSLKEQTKLKYSLLIDLFFNQAHETSKFHDFIQLNPDFQTICLIVFTKIATQTQKRTQSSNLHQLNSFKTTSFHIIRNLCSKFLIEINHFGYDEPTIQIIALANQERFVFLCESDHLFLLTLEKFQFLNVRRKSSHNISVIDKNQKSLRKSSHNKSSLKKNSWSELDESAHFKTGEASKDHIALNIIDSDETSNYESSVLKSESKVNQLSDESTPKFKHSSIAHLRKKSHKDSFGGVDFDNMVYKDLANPKRYADQKAHRQKDHVKNFASHTQIYNKKVLSQRFETNQLESLTYVDDEESSIEFVPRFQLNQGNQNGRAIFGDSPVSPAYSDNTYAGFSQFQSKFQMHQKSKMIQRMKGSSIEKRQNYFSNESNVSEISPDSRHKNGKKSPGKSQRTHSPGSRALASSQIIEFTDSFFKQQSSKEQNLEFLVIPSVNSKFNAISEKDSNENYSLFSTPQKEVFMSFSKHDKEKFLVTDSLQNEENQVKSARKAERGTKDTLQAGFKDQDDSDNNVRTRKYSYRTQRQQRQKFRSKMKIENQADGNQTMNSFISEYGHSVNSKKPQYKKYNDAQNQFENNSEINLKNSRTFTNVNNHNQIDLFKLQRKHSSNIPVYKASEPQQIRPRHHEVNLNSKNFQKRFQQNSVRFSQIFENNEDQIFYVQHKEESRESFGNRKQRKVTDFYEKPLINSVKGGNRSSQIIENGASHPKNNSHQSRFEGNLEVSHDNINILINSGGGKNYSVISNISYDEEKRIEDLIQLQNQQGITRKQPHESLGTGIFNNQQIDLGNIQAIERLLLKKKQQKLKLSCQQSVAIVQGKSNAANEPKGWVKKQVFYFFEQTPSSSLRPPEKHVIVNPERGASRVVRESSVKSNSQTRDLPSSSTSLHNFSTKLIRQENPQFEGDREKSVSNKSLGDRKYSVKEMIKPVSQINFSSSLVEIPLAQKSQVPIFIGSHGANFVPIRENKGTGVQESDKLSVYTQPAPHSIIKLSPPRRHEPVHPLVVPSQKSLKISAQNLKTYPSQPIIRFTLGSSPAPLVQQPPLMAHQMGTLRPMNSQQTIKTFRMN